MAISDYFMAGLDVFKEELPGFLGRTAIPAIRGKFRASLAKSAPKSRFMTVRLLEGKRINSVNDRVRNMPDEWEGHKNVKRIIVFHDADEAGPHVEWYIEVDGQCYNIGVKRLSKDRMKKYGLYDDKRGSDVMYNSKGELTGVAKERLLQIVKDEFEGTKGTGSWTGQSTDHTPEEARESWTNFNPKYQGKYGAGRSRNVLADDEIEVWKLGNTIEGRDYTLSKHKDFYVHKFKETEGGQVILRVGLKDHHDINVHDRLHLKGHIGEESYEKFVKNVGEEGIVTIKEDGASFHFKIDKHGFHAYSPRISKETGKRISYRHKLGNIRHLRAEDRYQGMGELVLIDKKTGKPIKAHETGGFLNKNAPIPDRYEPRLVIYRIDKVGRKKVINESYHDNLERIQSLTDELGDDRITAPVLVEWEEALQTSREHEGLVGIAKDSPITNGNKFKPRGDAYDWTLTEVELEPGSKGGIAGVCWFESESGKRYKIGASSMGNRESVLEIMNNPDKYEGRVAKVECYPGHEGRAAKFKEWHLDKGTA